MTPLNVLVLCAGNIGRSPLGEVLLRAGLARALGLTEAEMAAHGIVVSSAGTDAPEGHEASSRGIPFARRFGLDLTGHRARQLTPEMLDEADVVFCMDNTHIGAVEKMAPEAGDKARLFAGEGVEIPDPRYHDDDFFDAVGRQILAAADRLIPVLLERIGEIDRTEEHRGPF